MHEIIFSMDSPFLLSLNADGCCMQIDVLHAWLLNNVAMLWYSVPNEKSASKKQTGHQTSTQSTSTCI